MEVNHLLESKYEPFDTIPIYDGVRITKMPNFTQKSSLDEEVMIVCYDKGFQAEIPYLIVGKQYKNDLYITKEFKGTEAELIYKVLKGEKSIIDILFKSK